MPATKTPKAPKKTGKKRKPTQHERLATSKKATALAIERKTWLESLSPKERRELIKTYERILADSAPPAAALESDLLKMLQVIGAEFIAHYFPDATDCDLMLSKRPKNGPPEWNVMIPMPVLKQ